MTTKDRTHDISSIDHHVKDVDTLCQVLNQALTAAFPRSSRSRYSDVYVLLISWENDDLGVVTEIDELEVLLRHMYHYRTDQWKIPSNKSHNAVVRRIMQSLEDFESTDNLLIVYYGGHGYMNEDRQCVWLCNQRPGAATVQWSSIQTNLEEADSDVLILLDCCAAASSAGGSGNGITELIAACGFEDFAPGVGEHSFTRSLIEELRYYGQRPGPISTAFLHNKVLARAKKSWNPRYQSAGAQERRKTPIHIHLADRSKQRCIELTPLAFPPELRDTLSQSGSLAPSTSPSEVSEMSNLGGSSQTSLNEVWPDPEHNSPKVLISVALEEDQFLRTEDVLDWLKSFPALAKCVHIESAYKSDSTLLLLSLPVALWDMLPNDPAISFVAFVKSANLLGARKPVEVKGEVKKQLPKKAILDHARTPMPDLVIDKYGRPSVHHTASPKRLTFSTPQASNTSPITSFGHPGDPVPSQTADTKALDLKTKTPTYIKVHNKHVELETLQDLKLPWEYDDRDFNYIIIKRWMDQKEQDDMFARSQLLRDERDERDRRERLERPFGSPSLIKQVRGRKTVREYHPRTVTYNRKPRHPDRLESQEPIDKGPSKH